MKPVGRDEAGIGLALAIVALVIIGVLIAGMSFTGTRELRVGENARDLQQSFGVAEEGVFEVIRTWDPATYNLRDLYPRDSAPVPADYPGSWAAAPHRTGAYGGYVYKLNGELYLIDITGRDARSLGTTPAQAVLRQRGGGARQRIGLLAHIRPLHIDLHAVLTTRKAEHLSDQVAIEGSDRVPPGWAPCGPLDSAQAAIRFLPGADDGFSRFGDVAYTHLVALASSTVPGATFGGGIEPVVVNGRCDQTVATNWGDPLNPGRPCGAYFPIVHVSGDAVMRDLAGQGILVVDGNLTLEGGFRWFGIVLVRGSLAVVPAGAADVEIWGVARVRDSVTAVAAPGLGLVLFRYSKCAVVKALDAVATVGTLRRRGWIRLF